MGWAVGTLIEADPASCYAEHFDRAIRCRRATNSAFTSGALGIVVLELFVSFTTLQCTNLITPSVANRSELIRAFSRLETGVPLGGHRMRKQVFAAALVIAAIGPAMAQTSTEYYIVQDTTTKRCTIVDKKPTATTTVVVGDGKIFKTRTEAEAGMKTVKVCTTN